MMKGIVISLFDESGNMVRPWAEAGYTCLCFDVQNTGKCPEIAGKGMILYFDTFITEAWVDEFVKTRAFWAENAIMVFGFPPCTDLAVSGASRFEAKRQKNPKFQKEATDLARLVELLGNKLKVPWFAENPVSVLSTLWRKPDHSFHPYEYGGYLAADDIHPRYPEYLAARDAYTKKTCLWTGNGFKMPEKRLVDIQHTGNGQGIMTLGGKSARTKKIRSETPRGFALAVYEANHG